MAALSFFPTRSMEWFSIALFTSDKLYFVITGSSVYFAPMGLTSLVVWGELVPPGLPAGPLFFFCSGLGAFFSASLIFCSPELGIIRHYPRNLVHCFVEDKRTKPDPEAPELLFRAELFSVTPENEQLCWVRDCVKQHDIPSAQSAISN